MSPKKLNVILAVVTLAVCASLVILNVRQSQHESSINEDWNNASLSSIQLALDLASVERAFGYVGFIHHFKNYVLRRDESYYREATKSYWETHDALQNLILMDLPEQDLRDLIEVQRVLNEYFRNLNDAYLHYSALPAEELDKLIKVDDKSARAALSRLRKDLIPNLNEQYADVVQSNQLNDKWSLLNSAFPLLVVLGFALAISAISRKALVRAKEVDVIFQASPDAFIYTDMNGKILRVNTMATEIFGYSKPEFKRMSIEDLMEPEKRANHVHLREAFIKHQGKRVMGGISEEIYGVTKSGDKIPLNIAISSFSEGRSRGSVAIVRDITDIKRLEQDSTHDALTGVFNRRHIEERLEDEVKRAKRYGRALSLFVIDVDYFKRLNDSEGHRAGDEGLIKLADHLKSQLRKHDHIGRWGGDEFLVICPELSEEDAMEIGERIRRRFEALPFPWDNPLTLSVGVSTLALQGGVDGRTLFDQADQALYRAKERGRNCVEHFSLTPRPRRVK